MARIRILAVSLSALALAGLALVLPTAAQAANGVADDITDDIVQGVTAELLYGDDATDVWDQLNFTFALSTEPTSVDEGDFFVVEFPDELTVPSTTLALRDEGGVVLADCVSDTGGGTVTCILNGTAAARQFVTGAFQAQAQVNNQATGESFSLTIGNEVVVLDYPGGAVGPVGTPTYPDGVNKYGWQLVEQPNLFYWTVVIPVDAVSGDTITVVDTLDGPTRLVGDPGVAIQSWASESDFQNGIATYTEIPLGTSTQTLAGGGSTTVTLASTSDREFTLTFDNVVPSGGLYYVRYYSEVSDDIVEGEVLNNTASVNGSPQSAQEGYIDRMSGNLRGPVPTTEPTPTASAGLPSTGAEFAPGGLLVGLAVVLLGGAGLAVRRRASSR